VTRDPQALAQACADVMWADDRASPGLGMALDAVGPGRATMSMEVAPRMVNGHGTCHGGFIFALADSAFAFACNTRNERAVASHCSIAFLRPANLGDRLVAVAEERTVAGRSGIYDIRVSVGGTVVAEFRGHCRQIGSRFFEDAP
jgi:acyl-CoA thioesterase